MVLNTLLLRPYILVIVALFSNTLTYAQNEEFDEFIGIEKAKVLHKAIASFENFLSLNYSASASYNQSVTAFLTDFNNQNIDQTLDKWVLDSSQTEKLIIEFEQSGLRKDIWLYIDEIDSPNQKVMDYILYVRSLNDTILYVETDTVTIDDFEELLDIPEVEGPENFRELEEPHAYATYNSAITAGIHKFSADSILREYAEIQLDIGSISPHLIASAMLEYGDKVNYNSFYTKAMLVKEFYFDILYPFWLRKNSKDD
jgi:hypothetical protein